MLINFVNETISLDLFGYRKRLQRIDLYIHPFSVIMASITFGKEKVKVNAGKSIEDTVRSIGRFPDTFIFIVNGNPVPMTSILSENDNVEAVKIASGG